MRTEPSVLWRAIWPCAVAVLVLRLLMLLIAFDEGAAVRLWWNPSLVQAPGVSLLDAVMYLLAGYYGSQRTGLVRTGLITAAATTFIGFTIFFIWAAIRTPSLLMIPFREPFSWVIMTVLLAIALGFGLVMGAVGSVLGRWLPPTSRQPARVS